MIREEEAVRLYWATRKCGRFEDYIDTISRGNTGEAETDGAFCDDIESLDESMLLMRVGMIERCLRKKGYQ